MIVPIFNMNHGGQRHVRRGEDYEYKPAGICCFCIENIAIRLEKNAEEIYKMLTEESNILSGYIIPEYEILHTQSKDYIVDNIISLMRKGALKYDFISRFLSRN